MPIAKRRSKLEQQFEQILQSFDVLYDYEITKIPYIIPQSDHTYTVDWTVNGGLLLETKGYLSDHAERKKYILIKEQHPDIDLRFVFADPNKKCGGMKTTHAQWADKNNFTWCSIKDTEQIKQWVTKDYGKTPSNSRQSSKTRRGS